MTPVEVGAVKLLSSSKYGKFEKGEPVDMTQVGGNTVSPFGNRKSMNECTATKELCKHYMVINEKYQEPVYYCAHIDNKGIRGIDDCTPTKCPLCNEGGG